MNVADDMSNSSCTMMSCPSSLSSARSFASSSRYRAGSLLDLHDQFGAIEVNMTMQHSAPHLHMGPRHAASVPGSLRMVPGVRVQPDLRSTLSHQDLAHKHADRSAHLFRLPPPRPIMRDRIESPRKIYSPRETMHFDARSVLHRQRKDSPLSYFSTSCSRSSSCSSSCTCSVDSPSNCSPSPRQSRILEAYESSSHVPECTPREIFFETQASESQNTLEMESTIGQSDAEDNSKLLKSNVFLPIPPECHRRCIKPSSNHTRHYWMRHLAPKADTLPDTWLDLINNGKNAKETSTDCCLWAPERLWASPQQRPAIIKTNGDVSRQASPLRSFSKLPKPPDDIADIQSLWNEVAEDADVGPASPLKNHGNVSKLEVSKSRELKLRKQSMRAVQEELSSQAAADHWSTFVDDADGHSIDEPPSTNTWSLQNQQALGEWKSKINMLKVRRNRLLKSEVELEQSYSCEDQDKQEVTCSLEQTEQKVKAPVEIATDELLSSGEEDWCIDPAQRSFDQACPDTGEALQRVEPPMATWRHHRRASKTRSQVDSPAPKSPKHLAQQCSDASARIKHQALERVKTKSVVEAFASKFSKSASRRAKVVHTDTWILDDAQGSYAAQSGGRAKRRQSADGRLLNEEISHVDESRSKSVESRRAVKFTDVPDQISPRVARQSLHRFKMAATKVLDEPEVHGRVNRKSLRSSLTSKHPKRSTSAEL